MKKKIIFILTVLLVLEIPVLLYLLNFRFIAFDKSFYKEEFLKYGVYSRFPDHNIDDINSNLLSYLKGDAELETEFFSQREKNHLSDVKALIQFFIFLLYSSLIVFIILLTALIFISKQQIYSVYVLIFGGILTLIDTILFYILIRINFSFIFSTFHKIFFEADSWLFTATDNLINLYPIGFFYDITAKIIINTLVSALLLVIIGLVIRRVRIKKHTYWLK